MRKFLSMLLVLTLMFALAVPAFAADHTGSKTFVNEDTSTSGEEKWGSNTTGGNQVTFDAHAKLSQGTTSWGGRVYKVKITWTANDVTVDTGANNGKVTVTITNRSNDEITATLAYVSETVGMNQPSSSIDLSGQQLIKKITSASDGTGESGILTNLIGAEKSDTFTANVSLTDAGNSDLSVNTNNGQCVKIGTFTVTIKAGELTTG